jgi:hypothetical protein
VFESCRYFGEHNNGRDEPGRNVESACVRLHCWIADTSQWPPRTCLAALGSIWRNAFNRFDPSLALKNWEATVSNVDSISRSVPAAPP